jgi:hypothetical protein
MATDYDLWLLSGPGGPHDDSRIGPACCEQCDGPLTEDDYEDFGICEACYEANQQAAEKGIREGADEKGYSEEQAA